MAGQTVALNQAQKITSTPLNGTNTDQTPPNDIIYTCPANHKAKFKGSINADSFGAGGSVQISVNGAQNVATATVIDVPVSVPETSLEAGDTIKVQPNVGTNADIEYSLTIEVTPA